MASPMRHTTSRISSRAAVSIRLRIGIFEREAGKNTLRGLSALTLLTSDGRIAFGLRSGAVRLRGVVQLLPIADLGRWAFIGSYGRKPFPPPPFRILESARQRCGWDVWVSGSEVAHSVGEALALAGGAPVSVIGGAEIFALFEDRATAVELTEVLRAPAGDTILPPFDPARWTKVASVDGES